MKNIHRREISTEFSQFLCLSFIPCHNSIEFCCFACEKINRIIGQSRMWQRKMFSQDKKPQCSSPAVAAAVDYKSLLIKKRLMVWRKKDKPSKESHQLALTDQRYFQLLCSINSDIHNPQAPAIIYKQGKGGSQYFNKDIVQDCGSEHLVPMVKMWADELTSLKVRRGCQILWNWSYGLEPSCGYWELNLGLLKTNNGSSC